MDILRSLARQMGFAPRAKRLTQLSAAEDLLLRVDADRGYPADFVVHAITAYRPKSTSTASAGGDASELIAGVALQHDLGLLLERVSDEMSLAVADVDEPVLTIDDVCRRFGVTSKSIQRWRRKGLPARRFVFEDDRQRVGFRLSCVERFVARQDGTADRPAGVEPMTDAEQGECVRRARKLISGGHCRNEVVRRIARRLGRSSLAVLHTLEHHDRTSGEAVLSSAADGPSAAVVATAAEACEAGVALAVSARRSGLRRVEAYRAFMERRAERVAEAGVKYHDDPIYHVTDASAVPRRGLGSFADSAERQVRELVAAAESSLTPPGSSDDAGGRVPRGLPPYLADLYRTPLLTPALERALFLEFNFHKCRFAGLRNEVDPHLGRRRDLERMERHLRLARRTKNRIVTANLRLVVSVARKHLRRGLDLMELVSDGNIVLMRAVEGFDVHRGFRLSTYATLALMKGFARSVPQMQAARSSAAGLSVDDLGRRDTAFDAFRDREQVDHLLQRLDERERRVVTAQYGLADAAPLDPFVDDCDAVDSISRALGVSKQRVRQIEQSALDKLRRLTLESGQAT